MHPKRMGLLNYFRYRRLHVERVAFAVGGFDDRFEAVMLVHFMFLASHSTFFALTRGGDPHGEIAQEHHLAQGPE